MSHRDVETSTVASSNNESVANIAARLGVRIVDTLDENESFEILRCEGGDGSRLVLKYLRRDSADARRRLNNEALLTRARRDRFPPRLLTYRAHGTRYLLTDYDDGELLRPERLRDQPVADAVAEALASLHAISRHELDASIVDRERPDRYLKKVLAKHLLHLLPSYLTLEDAFGSWRALTRRLPSILERKSICHGDFLPTNLLYHGRDRTVTITDLEGFMTSNHPLFDVVALFTTDEGPLSDWRWQPAFLRHYLEAGGRDRSGDPRAASLKQAYHGLLVFFLVYRFNETRLHIEDETYFDGLSKMSYLRRRALGLPHEIFRRGARNNLEPRLEIRRRNLRQALTPDGFDEHWLSLTALSSSGSKASVVPDERAAVRVDRIRASEP